VYVKTEGSFLWDKFAALARTDEIVYRYWINAYDFIGCGRFEIKGTRNFQWHRIGLSLWRFKRSPRRVATKLLRTIT
jgi:hypothetical protein